MCGTAEFLAPEIVNYDDITVASDMWAVGYYVRNVHDDSVCNAILGWGHHLHPPLWVFPFSRRH